MIIDDFRFGRLVLFNCKLWMLDAHEDPARVNCTILVDFKKKKKEKRKEQKHAVYINRWAESVEFIGRPGRPPLNTLFPVRFFF